MASTIADWLKDTQDAAQLMAENIERLRESPGQMVMKVRLHAAAIEDAAEIAVTEAMNRGEEADFLGRAKAGGEGTPSGRGTAGHSPKKGLTPPSSNTGGKVGARRKTGRGS